MRSFSIYPTTKLASRICRCHPIMRRLENQVVCTIRQPINYISCTSHSYFSSTTTTPPVTNNPLATSVDDGIRPFQITTPIYYVNDKPHIGHAYTSIACDVIARFMRLSGRRVFFLSGTDEHGQKVEQSALQRGVQPQEFVDDVSKNFKDLLGLLNISNDKFIRTTSQEHKQSVQVKGDIMSRFSSSSFLCFTENRNNWDTPSFCFFFFSFLLFSYH